MPAADFVRAFARWTAEAARAPLFLTRHGKVTHAYVDIEHYNRLVAGYGTPASGEADTFIAFADFVGDGVILLDHDERITYFNSRARAFCKLHNTALGKRLTEAMPTLEGSVAVTQVRRTIRTRTALNADLPSVMVPGRWLHFQTFPVDGRIVCLFRDITDDVTTHRLADTKEAILDAINLHGDVGYMRINQRGLIERVDQSFCDWIGLTHERLHNVRLLDLVATSHRPTTAEMLEGALGTGQRRRGVTRIVPNGPGYIDLDIAAVPLKGEYGAEGAVLIYTVSDCDKG